MILGRVDDDFDFETTVFDAFVASGDDAEFGQRMATIGDGPGQGQDRLPGQPGRDR